MTIETAQTVVSDGHTRIAPDGWVFVTNDPEVAKAPTRIVSVLNRERGTVLIIDTQAQAFVIRDLVRRRDVYGSYRPDRSDAPWHIGNTPFIGIGDVGRAVEAVLARHKAEDEQEPA